MNTFYKTIIIASAIAAFFILVFAVTQGGEDLSIIGLSLVIFAPLIFFVGLIVAIATQSQSNGRQIGQGLMMTSLIYILIGFGCCSGGNLHL